MPIYSMLLLPIDMHYTMLCCVRLWCAVSGSDPVRIVVRDFLFTELREFCLQELGIGFTENALDFYVPAARQILRENLTTKQTLKKQLKEKQVELDREFEYAIAAQEAEYQEDLEIALANSRQQPLQLEESMSRHQVHSCSDKTMLLLVSV